MSDILLKQPAFTAGLPRLYIKVDLNWIILKNFKISASTRRSLREVLRKQLQNSTSSYAHIAQNHLRAFAKTGHNLLCKL